MSGIRGAFWGAVNFKGSKSNYLRLGIKLQEEVGCQRGGASDATGDAVSATGMEAQQTPDCPSYRGRTQERHAGLESQLCRDHLARRHLSLRR